MNATMLYLFVAACVLAALALAAAASPRRTTLHPAMALGVVAAVCVGALLVVFDLAALSARVRLDPSEEPMFPSNDPGLSDYREAVLNFGDDDLFVIVMRSDDVFTADDLRALREIGNEIRRVPGVRSVESVAETTIPRYDAARELFEVADFIDEIPEDAPTLARLRAEALTHRLIANRLIGPFGRAAALNVALQTMTDDEFVRARISERIAAVLAQYASTNRTFHVTGRQYVKGHAHRIMVRDLLTLIPLALAVGALTAWIATGSLLFGALPVATSAVATLWTFAAMVLLGRPLNIITLVLGPVLLCVGSVYGVHVTARFVEIAADGDRTEIAARCIKRVRTPVLVAGVTTCVGFGALGLSNTPAIRELGAFALFGVAAITLLSVAVLPVLLDRLPARWIGMGDEAAAHGVMAAAINRALAAAATASTRHVRATIGVWLLAAAVAVAALSAIRIDTDYLSFFDRDSRVRKDFDAIAQSLTGPVPIYVTVSADDSGAFRDPDNLRALERAQARIADAPGVDSTLSAVDLIEVANRAFERDDPAAERVPETTGEISELVFLSPKTDMRRVANTDQSRANIVVRSSASGSAAMRDLEHHLNIAVTDAHLPAALRTRITGSSILVNHNADGIARNQIVSVGAATAAIFVLIAVAFASLRLGALAMVPNVVPVLLFFGALGLGAGVLSLPTSLLGCIALGIAVDDTAHFLAAYHRLRSAGADAAGAAHRCITTLGRPIVVTSLMLSAGFLVLDLSGFATLRELGRLAALTMMLCLLADLTLLPALLVSFDQAQPTRTRQTPTDVRA